MRLHKNEEPVISFSYPIRIVFAGVMIEELCNIEILKEFNGDENFMFFYIGKECRGKQKIREYVESCNMNNVFFEGAYNKNEIIERYRNEADLVNIFRSNSLINRNALPNKLYEAVLSGKPIVVFEHNVAIADYVREFNLGIVIPFDMETKVSDFLLSKMKTFSYEKYKQGRICFINKVENDMKQFSDSIADFSRL